MADTSAIKGALETVFRTALPTIPVARGFVDPPNPEQIEVTGSDERREWRAMGSQPTPLNADIDITVVVTVAMQGGSDLKNTEDRLWVLVDAVEAAYRADITLGGLLRWGRISRIKQSNFKDKQQIGCQAEMTLSVRSVL